MGTMTIEESVFFQSDLFRCLNIGVKCFITPFYFILDNKTKQLQRKGCLCLY